MRRLYYLTDDIQSCEGISQDLHKAGITDWNFHVLSKDEAGLRRKHIHSANYFQKLDIIRDAERGAIVGLVAAALTVAFLSMSHTLGSHTTGLLYAAIFGFITLFGAWAGGMVGLATENQKVARYHSDIAAGKFLLMIDVKLGEEDRVRNLMAASHPEAVYKREGSTFVNPFKFVRSIPA